jgi:soluble lytic murein transglycosylase-like protein
VIWHVAREQPPDRSTAVAPPLAETAAAPLKEAAVPLRAEAAAPAPAETTGAAKSMGPPAESRSVSNAPWGSNTAPISTAASFVYATNHPATPLPALAFAAMTSRDPMNADEFGPTYVLPEKPFDASPGQLRILSRGELCSAIVAVAKANDLPIPFFANLIWQESSFRSKTISRAGALGIAQFIPETAVEHGLMNPFEPVHALFASGRLLRKLGQQFGNLGMAAAAYNAGPQRVYDWLGARRRLPAETRDYVVRITGHRADRWRSSEFRRGPEAALMPARAPCVEVATEVKAQAHFVRVSQLMLELVAATAPPPVQANVAALPTEQAKPPQKKPEQSGKPAQSKLAHAQPAPKDSAVPQKPAQGGKPAQSKLAHAKPEPNNSAAPQKPVARPASGVRVVGTTKDQSRLPAARVSAKPADAAVRHVAVQ